MIMIMTSLDIKTDNRKQYFKDYFIKNKEKLTENFFCEECGGKYKKMGIAHHIKTKKHQNVLLIKKLQKENETIRNMIYDINKKVEKI